MNKPKIFVVTRTPKDIDNAYLVEHKYISTNYCAVVNVSDSPCATFDYQRVGIPSFWFPINEIGIWGHSPFYGTLKVVNEYYTGDKPVLIHCHAGANRSPSIAYAILLAKGYTEQEAEESLEYESLSNVFKRNVTRKHIPENIIGFLKMADRLKNSDSLHMCLKNIDALYDELAQKKFDEQNDYPLENSNRLRLVYNKDKKRFVIIENPNLEKPNDVWIEPIFTNKEWYITPLKDK